MKRRIVDVNKGTEERMPVTALAAWLRADWRVKYVPFAGTLAEDASTALAYAVVDHRELAKPTFA